MTVIIVGVVGAHRSICKVHCKEMVNTGSPDHQ